MFPYFMIGGKMIGTYALCAVTGLVACGGVGVRMGRKYKITLEEILLLMIAICLGLLVGGHLLYGFTHIHSVIELLRHVSEYSIKEAALLLVQYFGGMVFYGGFIGGALAAYFYEKHKKVIPVWAAMDLYGVSIPLFHAFGRIGCFLGGCCYGKESSWGFLVENNTLQPAINGVVRIPIQLIEAGCNFFLFLFLFYLYRRNIQEGKLIYVYMLIYPVIRFVTEFFRGDEIRGFFLWLSTSQWISVILFLIAVWKLTDFRHKDK